MATNTNNEDGFDDFEDEDLEPRNPDNSELLRKLRLKTRADEKRIKELEAEVGGYKKASNESVLKTILDQKGINPKAAALIARELDEVTEQTVTEWLKLNGDIFGTAVETNDNENDPNLQELRNQDNLTKTGMSSTNESDLIKKLQNSSDADFKSMMREAGVNL